MLGPGMNDSEELPKPRNPVRRENAALPPRSEPAEPNIHLRFSHGVYKGRSAKKPTRVFRKKPAFSVKFCEIRVPQKNPNRVGFFAEPLSIGFFLRNSQNLRGRTRFRKNNNFSQNTLHAFESDSSVRISFLRNKGSAKKPSSGVFCGTLILRKNRLGGLLRNTLYLGFISIRTEQKSTRRDHSNEHGQASTKVNAYPASTSTR